tara:strand:- start:3553 stop:3891 length:339 start_codon:yes stop_codon:yes gene_type:complete
MDTTLQSLVTQDYSCIYDDDRNIIEKVYNIRYDNDKDLIPPDDFLDFMATQSYKLSPDSIKFLKEFEKDDEKEDETLETPKRPTKTIERRTEESKRLKTEGGGSSSKPDFNI